jgi:hypothetical protein
VTIEFSTVFSLAFYAQLPTNQLLALFNKVCTRCDVTCCGLFVAHRKFFLCLQSIRKICGQIQAIQEQSLDLEIESIADVETAAEQMKPTAVSLSEDQTASGKSATRELQKRQKAMLEEADTQQ